MATENKSNEPITFEDVCAFVGLIAIACIIVTILVAFIASLVGGFKFEYGQPLATEAALDASQMEMTANLDSDIRQLNSDISNIQVMASFNNDNETVSNEVASIRIDALANSMAVLESRISTLFSVWNGPFD
jgi:hypothetical protein